MQLPIQATHAQGSCCWRPCYQMPQAAATQHCGSHPGSHSSATQAEAGLEALSKCLQAGFEGYNKIREDPNLAKVRADPGFQPLIEEYDEPVISGEAIKYALSLPMRPVLRRLRPLCSSFVLDTPE